MKMKTNWNLKLLYSSPKDPQIERDLGAIERACEAFEKKYRGKKNYLSSEAALLGALKDYERLHKKIAGGKPIVYFFYVKELDSSNQEAEARIRQFEERLTKAGNRIQFFDLALGKIPPKKQKEFLASKKLARYRRLLERTFETAKHDLTEPEEKILALKSMPARSMWTSGVENALNLLTVPYKKNRIPVNEAIAKVSTIQNTKERRALWDATIAELSTLGSFAESEINAVFTDKKINDELRGFKEPYDATILGYENDRESVLALVDAVTRRFDISARFYSLKRKLLGFPRLEYADRSTSIGTMTRKYPLPEAAGLVRDAFAGADPAYAQILDQFLKRGQIDVFPKRGKGGGAFCSSAVGLPTYVMLNHVDDLRSVSTLAHEMGHAIHSERSKKQPPIYEGYSIAVAETASTFFEGLAFESLKEGLSERERMFALHDSLQDTIATISRQIAFFNFELELHQRIRTEGWVPKGDILKLLNKHTSAYLGPAVHMKEEDGWFFVAVGHFRRPFYVYSYAYGELISKALLKRYKEDPSYIKKVDQFLSAGSSKKPEQIFADIGIKVGPKLFEEGLDKIEEEVKELERLTKKFKM